MGSGREQFSELLVSHCKEVGELGSGGVGRVDKVEFVWEGPDGRPVKIGSAARKTFGDAYMTNERRRRLVRANTELAARVRHILGYAFSKGMGVEEDGKWLKPVFYYEFIDTGWNYMDFAKKAKEIPLLTRFLHACAFLRLRLQAWREAFAVGISNVDQKPENNIPTDFTLHEMPSDGGHTFLWLPERIAMVDMDCLIDKEQADEKVRRRGIPVWSPPYLAPEQAMCRYGFRSELFSIGTSALEILTGQVVFFETKPSWLIEDIAYRSDIIIRYFLQDTVVPMANDLPREYRDTLRDFENFVEALTRFEPKDRPSTEEEFRRACNNNPLLMEGPSAIGRRCENVRGVTREQIIQMLSLRTRTEKLL